MTWKIWYLYTHGGEEARISRLLVTMMIKCAEAWRFVRCEANKQLSSTCPFAVGQYMAPWRACWLRPGEYHYIGVNGNTKCGIISCIHRRGNVTWGWWKVLVASSSPPFEDVPANLDDVIVLHSTVSKVTWFPLTVRFRNIPHTASIYMSSR